MALYALYTYKFQGTKGIIDLIGMIKHSIEVCLILGSNPKQEYIFIYDANLKKMILTDYHANLNFFQKPVTIEDFLIIIGNHTFYIKSKVRYDKDLIINPSTDVTITVLNIRDYPRMISDLEKVGMVETCETNSIMAIDNRKFRFAIDDDVQYYDVDCLGTRLCVDLSARVENRWSKYCV